MPSFFVAQQPDAAAAVAAAAAAAVKLHWLANIRNEMIFLLLFFPQVKRNKKWRGKTHIPVVTGQRIRLMQQPDSSDAVFVFPSFNCRFSPILSN